MTLAEIPFDEIKTGTRVLSCLGTEGTVVKIYKDNYYKDFDTDGWMIKIDWDNGKSSENRWYFFKVEVI